MTAQGPEAGWYPDVTTPGGERYWDGQRWTDARRDGQGRVPPPAPTVVATPPPKKRWSSVRRVVVVIVSILIAGAAAAWISTALGSLGTSSDDSGVDTSDASNIDCSDLASQAVRVSKDKDVQLLKVRNPVVKVDNRDTFTTPTGDGEALILSCTGEGVWSNDEPARVLLRYTVDSDGDTFVAYTSQ